MYVLFVICHSSLSITSSCLSTLQGSSLLHDMPRSIKVTQCRWMVQLCKLLLSTLNTWLPLALGNELFFVNSSLACGLLDLSLSFFTSACFLSRILLTLLRKSGCLFHLFVAALPCHCNLLVLVGCVAGKSI